MSDTADELWDFEVIAKDARRQLKLRAIRAGLVVGLAQDETDDRDHTAPLRIFTRLLPVAERGEWLEEQRAYLADLSTRRKRWAWILAQVIAMPKYAYTVRDSREKGPA